MKREPILIVDDNAQTLRVTRVLLMRSGYDVQTAVDAEQALSLLETFKPRLILMDPELPGMDGYELTRRLKAHPDTRQITVIALTAFAMIGDAERARSAGCDGFVTKPIDARALPTMVAKYIERTAPDLLN